MTTQGVVTKYWYTQILTDKMVKFNNADIVIWNDTEQTVKFIAVTVQQDYNVVIAIANKITKYKDLQIEIKNARTWKKLLLGRL